MNCGIEECNKVLLFDISTRILQGLKNNFLIFLHQWNVILKKKT